MLKIKDNVDLIKMVKDYGLDSEIYEADIEMGYMGEEVFDRDGVFISHTTREIYGRDNDSLELLYDLIKADLVEKVSE